MLPGATVALALSPLFAPGAAAQTAAPDNAEPPPPIGEALHAAEEKPFHITFTPLVWLTSFNGDAGIRGVEIGIDESFLDIVDNSDTVFGLYGAIDGVYKRLVFQINGAYSTATFSDQRGRARSGPAGGGAGVDAEGKVEMDAAWFEAFGGYRFVDTPLGDDPHSKSRFVLDGFIGGRVTSIQLEAKVSVDATVTLPGGQVLEAGRRNGLDQKEGWFEPFIGARATFELGEHWNIGLRGDIGGFGVDDSEFAWQAIGAVGYRWRHDGWTLNLFAGYRALGQDYERGGFTWDMIVHGPVLGAQFSIAF